MWDFFNVIIMLITSIILLLVSFINISPYKLSFSEYIKMILSIIIIHMSIYLISPRLASIALYFIPVLYIYKKNKKILRSFILEIVICSVTVIVNSCVSNIIILFFGDEFIENIVGYYITYILIVITLYFVSKVIGRTLNKYKKIIDGNYKSKYLFIVYVMLILTFALFYLNINWNSSSNPVYLSKVNGVMFMVYGLVMIIVCFTLLFMIRKEEKFRYEQIELENLKEYTENLEKLYMDMRKFRHDYINIISSMAGFIQDRDLDALEKHFNEHIYPLNNKINKNNYKLGLLKNIELPEIKGLISAKVIRAQELGIDTIIDIAEPIKNINMDIIDLSRILGIILDNSIEAALESDKRTINIALINKNKSVIIVVINSFKGEILSVSRLFKEGFSTKGENRGLGLSNLKEIINRYNNVSLDTCIKEKEFIQEVSISSR